MSYNYLTQWDSPNYTPKSQTRAVWGKDRNIQAIAIHWWGDPNTNPTFEGVVATLLNPARQASAHFVATGTGRRVACLVSPEDNSWATNSANPTTISIECDPRCRPEDYDVVAELIADIRSAYGNLPLVPHRQFVATQCPGNWDLNALSNLANTKVSHEQWGQVTDKNPPVAKASAQQIAALYLEILERPVDQEGINHYVNYTVEFVRNDLLASQERKNLEARKAAEQAAAIEAARLAEEKIKFEQAEAIRIAKEKEAQEIAKALAEKLAAEKAAQEAAEAEANKAFYKKVWEAIYQFIQQLIANYKK